MKIFNRVFKHGSKILKNINPTDKKQLDEIKRLEKQIEAFQEEEKKSKKDFRITNRHFVKFW